jgi:hypothetical protein
MTMARHSNVELRHRRTARWTLCIMGMCALKAVGLKMPKAVLLWCARAPIQVRAGRGPWQTVRLDPAELQRRFGK